MFCKEFFEEIEALRKRKLTAPQMLDISTWPDTYNTSGEEITELFRAAAEKGSVSIKEIKATLKKRVKGKNENSSKSSKEDGLKEGRKRIFKALGFHRYPTEEEERVMNEWLTEELLDMNDILEACRATVYISSPNIAYVNKVISTTLEKKRAGEAHNNEEESQKDEEREVAERYEMLCDKLPELKELDDKIASMQCSIMRNVLSGKDTTKEQISVSSMLKARSGLLKINGYSEEYLIIEPEETVQQGDKQ